MTIPQVIFVLVIAWLFIAIGGYIAAKKESKRKLKAIQDAHKAEQTTISDDELEAIPDLDPLWWEELGIELGERPYVKLR